MIAQLEQISGKIKKKQFFNSCLKNFDHLYDLEVEKGKDADKGKWPPTSFFTASKAVAGNCVICMKIA